MTVEAEQAEALLLINKPFTEFVSPLTQLVHHCLIFTPSLSSLSTSVILLMDIHVLYNTE